MNQSVRNETMKKRELLNFFDDELLDELLHAAKAIKCGYLYREDDILYAKILVSDMRDMKRLLQRSFRL